MFCPNCNSELADGSTSCPYCGAGSNNSQQQQQQQQQYGGGGGYYEGKSKTTALLLCIFLGGLGAHRFYVGKTGSAIVWLLTAGLFGIGSIYDLIMIITDKFYDNDGQPLV